MLKNSPKSHSNVDVSISNDTNTTDNTTLGGKGKGSRKSLNTNKTTTSNTLVDSNEMKEEVDGSESNQNKDEDKEVVIMRDIIKVLVTSEEQMKSQKNQKKPQEMLGEVEGVEPVQIVQTTVEGVVNGVVERVVLTTLEEGVQPIRIPTPSSSTLPPGLELLFDFWYRSLHLLNARLLEIERWREGVEEVLGGSANMMHTYDRINSGDGSSVGGRSSGRGRGKHNNVNNAASANSSIVITNTSGNSNIVNIVVHAYNKLTWEERANALMQIALSRGLKGVGREVLEFEINRINTWTMLGNKFLRKNIGATIINPTIATSSNANNANENKDGGVFTYDKLREFIRSGENLLCDKSSEVNELKQELKKGSEGKGSQEGRNGCGCWAIFIMF